MAFEDKEIQCTDCGTTFTFSVADQEFFQSKGYTNEPKRCAPCRAARKAERGGGFGGGRPTQMYPAVCAACGQDTQVPFQPRGDKPVYCSDCFRKVGSDR